MAKAKKIGELDISVNILYLDSNWCIFGKINGKGGPSFEWRRHGFPSPKAMFDILCDLNYQMVGLYIRLRIDNRNLKNYLNIAKEKGFTYQGNGKLGDFLNFFIKKQFVGGITA